jgi:hypothetical protein
LERQVLVHGRERDPSKNCAFSSADLPYDCFPGTKMVNPKDRSFEEEFSLEGRNTGQGIWRTFNYQLANDMQTKRNRGIRGSGP